MRIMHAPQHVGRALGHNFRSVAGLHPRSVGFTELDRGQRADIPALLRLLPAHTICSMDRGEHSQEAPIGFREGLFAKVEHVSVIRLSRVIGDGGIGNDRWATIVRFKRFGRHYAHVATHWDAGLQNRGNGNVAPDNPRAIAMAGAYRLLKVVLRHLVAEGREVFVTGDFNYRMHQTPGFQLWEFSPQNLFRELGMSHFEDGLDYLAWTPGVEPVRPIRVIPTGDPLNMSDHPWLIGDFRRVKKKK